MNRNIYQAISQYSLLEQQDRVVVGFSGGADSSALLHFLSVQLAELNLSLTACHINHQLRGEESLRDELSAQAFCQQLNIPCRTFSVNVAAVAREQYLSVEEAARQVRYHIFSCLAEELDAKIATAHTRSDSIETVLLNMVRGTGLKGLAGIPPKRGNIIRPLIFCTRQEVEAYCAQHQIPYVTDSTNLSDCYTRNRLRHQVVPALEEIRPGFSQSMGRMMEILRQEDDFLSQTAQQAKETARRPGGFSLAALSQLPPALLRRTLLSLLAEAGCAQSYGTIQRLEELILLGKGKVQVDQTHIFTVNDGLLFSIYPSAAKEPIPPFAFPLRPGIFPLPTSKLAEIILIDCKNVKFYEKDNPLYLKSLLDYDRIKDSAVIRTRREGDRFSLPQRKVSKSLKKLFNEEKIPPQQRERITLIADEEGILWMEGFGAASQAAVNRDTRQAIAIKITEMGHDR